MRSRGILRKAKGDHLDRVFSGQKVLEMIRRGRLILVIGDQDSQASSWDHQARVHSDQMALVMARREAGLGERRPDSRAIFLWLKLKIFK
jgi:hypothetical protein